MIVAIDPGDKMSAFVRYDATVGMPVAFGKFDNETILDRLDTQRQHEEQFFGAHLAIEMIASYGMPVGREVFETCVWIGRFIQAWRGSYSYVYRKDVKLHLCGQPRAKDSNIRQALIDRYGGKDVAIGKKNSPGPLYCCKADIWQALAVAVTYGDQVTRKAAA